MLRATVWASSVRITLPGTPTTSEHGRDHRSRTDHGAVHHGGVHAHGHIVLDGGAVHDGIVAHRHAIAQRDGAVVVAVQHGVVLHVAVLANADGRHFAADDGAEPHRAALVHRHVAADRRIRRDERGFLHVGEHPLEFNEHAGSFPSGTPSSIPKEPPPRIASSMRFREGDVV